MPFTLFPQVAKSDEAVTAAHAMAQAHQEHLRGEHRSAMGHDADRPISDEEAAKLDAEPEDEQAVKAQRQHPDSGRWMATGETAHGAFPGPLVTALTQHQGPAPLADLVTVPGLSGGALGSSITANSGGAVVTSLDYRTAGAPAPSFVPIQPAPHTAPNGVRP